VQSSCLPRLSAAVLRSSDYRPRPFIVAMVKDCKDDERRFKSL
jgi:hypothetical protein